MQSYGIIFLISIACFGVAIICFSMLNVGEEQTEAVAPQEPRIYEGKTPQYDVEVEKGTYEYDPKTGKTNIPENEFDLYMLYTIDNLPRGQELHLNAKDQEETDKLKKSPEGHWNMFPTAVQNMPQIWTIAGHGLVLLRIK